MPFVADVPTRASIWPSPPVMTLGRTHVPGRASRYVNADEGPVCGWLASGEPLSGKAPRYPASPVSTELSAITTPTMDSPPSTPDATTTPFSSGSATPRAAQTRS